MFSESVLRKLLVSLEMMVIMVMMVSIISVLMLVSLDRFILVLVMMKKNGVRKESRGRVLCFRFLCWWVFEVIMLVRKVLMIVARLKCVDSYVRFR